MTLDYLRTAVEYDYNDFYFYYNGKSCGVENYRTRGTYFVYYGDDASTIITGGFDAVIREPFFDGKSILDIFDEIADSICFA